MVTLVFSLPHSASLPGFPTYVPSSHTLLHVCISEDRSICLPTLTLHQLLQDHIRAHLMDCYKKTFPYLLAPATLCMLHGPTVARDAIPLQVL